MDKYVLQQHIYEIGAELNCEIEFTYRLGGMMYIEENPPRIEVPRHDFWNNVETVEKAYAISLHELGHVYHGHTQGRPPYYNRVHYFTNGVLKSEAEAWKFALNNSLIDWTEEVKDFALNSCIMSYYKGSLQANGKPDRLHNGNRHHYEFIWDEPGDYFFSVIKELGYAG